MATSYTVICLIILNWVLSAVVGIAIAKWLYWRDTANIYKDANAVKQQIMNEQNAILNEFAHESTTLTMYEQDRDSSLLN